MDGDGVAEILFAPGPDPEAYNIVIGYTIIQDGGVDAELFLVPFNSATHGGRIAGGKFRTAGN